MSQLAGRASEESDPSSDEEGDENAELGGPCININERASEFLAQGEGTHGADESGWEDVFVPDEDDERLKVVRFLIDGCGCQKKCSTKITEEVLYEHILNIRDMTKEEKEMYVMGVILIDKNKKNRQGGERKRNSTELTLFGANVCKKMFLMAFDIGRGTLANLLEHVAKHGVVPRRHGNMGRKPAHALGFEDVKRAVHFIVNYADEFGMPQPAAPRGRDNIPPIYLTCQTTKMKLHTDYVRSCTESSHRYVKRSAFYAIWKTVLSHIKIASPREDVCATCEKLRKAQMDSITEADKLENSQKMHTHISTAQKEREVYNQCIKRAKETRGQQNEYQHYTFDFSQSVGIPHHARQMGPAYFTTLRKVQLFGFRDDGIPEQLNFLIDENESIGLDGSLTHGPDAVISMVDMALSRYSQPGSSFGIHADNCPGNYVYVFNLNHTRIINKIDSKQIEVLSGSSFNN